jgi:hypothetical protein
MLKLIKQKDFQTTVIVSGIVAILMLFYIFSLGNRMTKSRELYISAYKNYEEGMDSKALEELTDSIELWTTKDAKNLKSKIENQ